jgi:ADP-ribose pyrophosphatase
MMRQDAAAYRPRMPAPDTHKVVRQLLHKGRKFDFEVLEYPGRSGGTVRREVVRHPGAVVVLGVLDPPDGRIVLIRNYRPALERAIYELPAGTLEPGERPDACARRELLEETGFQAATVTLLGRFYTSPGMSDELMWAYLAVGLMQVGQQLKDGEEATVWPIAAAQALQMIETGELVDGKSILTLLLAASRGVVGDGQQ